MVKKGEGGEAFEHDDNIMMKNDRECMITFYYKEQEIF